MARYKDLHNDNEHTKVGHFFKFKLWCQQLTGQLLVQRPCHSHSRPAHTWVLHATAQQRSNGSSRTITEAFEQLGLSRHSSKDDVRAAYLCKMKQLHPDLNPGGGTTAVAASITVAYHELMQVPSSRPFDRPANDNMLLLSRLSPGRPGYFR